MKYLKPLLILENKDFKISSIEKDLEEISRLKQQIKQLEINIDKQGDNLKSSISFILDSIEKKHGSYKNFENNDSEIIDIIESIGIDGMVIVDFNRNENGEWQVITETKSMGNRTYRLSIFDSMELYNILKMLFEIEKVRILMNNKSIKNINN